MASAFLQSQDDGVINRIQRLELVEKSVDSDDDVEVVVPDAMKTFCAPPLY